MKKINATSQANEAIMNQVTNEITKGKKSGKSEQSEAIKPTRKDTKNRFIAFVVNKEEIGLNKFFKLFEAFKKEDLDGFKDYLFARNMDTKVDYSFKWFKENCPFVLDEQGNKQFAKWTKVTEKHPLNENEAYNRITEKGACYTLIPYNCYKANWEQYEQMLNHVIANIKRLKREEETEKKRKENEANKLKVLEGKEKQLKKLEEAIKKLKAA